MTRDRFQQIIAGVEQTYWEVMDDRGVIFSGYDEGEMRELFDGEEFEWVGDLKLVEVYNIKR